MIGQVHRQCIDVPLALVGGAERVHEHANLPQTEVLEEPPRQGDRLGVEVGILGTEGFDAHLIELAVATLLGLLVAKLRARVPHLPRQHGRVVFGERSAHRCGQLGAQRQPAAALVGEVIHFLGDHVGGLTQPGEHPEVLEHRGHQVAVPSEPGMLGEAVDQRPTALRVGAEQVPGADRRLELLGLG